MWNIVLISIAFTLALFGIFINRGGPIPSVHSFASSTLGWAFLGFLGVSLVFSFVVFLFRYKALRRAATLESMLSREAAFLLNNLLLLCVAFVTLWGVVYPLISQMFQGVTVTVAAPFYNQLNGPLLMTLVFLMGIGPLVPWRKGSISTLRRAAQVPALGGVIVLVMLLIFGIHKPFALLSFALCGFVTSSILQEWVRGTVVRHRRGESYPIAFSRLILANRPRYGGYIVHLAMVFLALGITGSSFYSVQRDIILAPGEKVNLNNYSIEYLGVREVVKSDRTEFFNDMKVQIDGGAEWIMTTWRAYYPDLRIASTRAAIRSTPLEDLYIVSTESMEDGSGVFRIMVKPLVWWMWLAGPVLILGTVVALWPERRSYLGRGLASKRISTDSIESY
jgi:cytochrome c-type biogenesis protein CcmF